MKKQLVTGHGVVNEVEVLEEMQQCIKKLELDVSDISCMCKWE